MKTAQRPRFALTPVAGVFGAVAVLVTARLLEGGALRALWQPTAALVVFGGTAAAVLISYPSSSLRLTATAIARAFTVEGEPLEPIVTHLFNYAVKSKRAGILALEPDVDRVGDRFMRAALALVVDGTNAATARRILETENEALREAAELPADVLETAAGYAPTLGILGAVLGLIHVMENLGEPARLGAGIAVAFVATVYGVGVANLLLLPLATKLRAQARHTALSREIVIEGAIGLREGLNPRLLEQQLRGYLPRRAVDRRQLA